MQKQTFYNLGPCVLNAFIKDTNYLFAIDNDALFLSLAVNP